MDDPAFKDEEPKTKTGRILHSISEQLTFFRVHLLAFTFIPLISSGIFYASNGQFPVPYLDCLFLCYSAMTVTGLSTINLSTLTAWQQVMLYLLMGLGDITVVSWTMVLVRKSYIIRKCEYVFKEKKRKSLVQSISRPIRAFKQRQTVDTSRRGPVSFVSDPTPQATLVNEKGVSEEQVFSASPEAQHIPLAPTMSRTSGRARFAPSVAGVDFERRRMRRATRMNTIREGVPIPPHRTTTLVVPKGPPVKNPTKYIDLGGFPGPITLFKKFFKRATPKTYTKLERKMTISKETTLEGNSTPWLSFDLLLSRNSDFNTEELSDEQLEELGGVEYRALKLLSYLVPLYFIGTQVIAFLLFAPWISSTPRYDSVFEGQPRYVEKAWFSWFQVMSAYTGGGLALVDSGMVPFQTDYLMMFGLMFAMLAGNHAMPIFLRFVIWIGSRITRVNSRFETAFSFLLDHPRRCFIYLFPSHQTWFLLITLTLFSAIEWIAFNVLDIGLPAYESLPTGTKALAGLFQGLSARASGFAIVPLSSMAPSLQFLYVVMMYIAVYPVAMSIRSTNVYEEQSLGVFEAPEEEDEAEPNELEMQKLHPRERVGKYVQWHLRRQMAVDIWWLVWGVFIIVIVERGNIMNEDMKWFDLFRVLFELVSAFGGIGLSLGLPYDNYSFVGAMKPLSKLVVIVIMVRGRHRGLPVAVDRAVLLPEELRTQKANEAQKHEEDNGQPAQDILFEGGENMKRTISPDRLSELNTGSSRPQNFDVFP